MFEYEGNSYTEEEIKKLAKDSEVSFEDYKEYHKITETPEEVKTTTTTPGAAVETENVPNTDLNLENTSSDSPSTNSTKNKNKDKKVLTDIDLVEKFKNTYENNGFEFSQGNLFGKHINVKAPNGESKDFYSATTRDVFKTNLNAQQIEDAKKDFALKRNAEIETFIAENQDEEAWSNTFNSRKGLESLTEDLMTSQGWRNLEALEDTSFDSIDKLSEFPDQYAEFVKNVREDIKEKGIRNGYEVSSYQLDKIVNNSINNAVVLEKAIKYENEIKVLKDFQNENKLSNNQVQSFLKGAAINQLTTPQKKIAQSWSKVNELQQRKKLGTSSSDPNDVIRLANEIKKQTEIAKNLTASYNGKNTKFWFEYDKDGVIVNRSGSEIPEDKIDITTQVNITKEELAKIKEKDFSLLQQSFNMFQVGKLNLNKKLNNDKYNVSVNGPRGRFFPLGEALFSKGYKEKDGVFQNVLLKDMVELSRYQNDTFGNFDKINPKDKEGNNISQGSMSDYVNILAAEIESNQATTQAYNDVYLMNIDPSSIERDSFFTAALKDNKYLTLGIGIGVTDSDKLDAIEEIANTAGIPLSKAQAENFKTTIAEELGSIGGGLPLIAAEFAVVGLGVNFLGGLSFLGNLNKLQKGYTAANTFVSRTKALGIAALKESITMGVVTGDPVTGAGFAIAGNYFGRAAKLFGGAKFTGVFNPLNQFLTKPMQGGLSFTSSSNASEFLNAAGNQITGNESWKTFMENKFPDTPFFDEGGLGRKYIGEFITGVAFSASKIKKHDVQLLMGKGKEVRNQLVTEYTTVLKSSNPSKAKIKNLEESIDYMNGHIREMEMDHIDNNPELRAVRVTSELETIQKRIKKETGKGFNFEVNENGNGMGGKTAEFIPGTSFKDGIPKIIIDASKVNRGVIPHEIVHFVSQEFGLNSPESMGRLRNIIEPLVNQALKEYGFNLKNEIKEKYKDQDKTTRPEEYIANVVELLQKEPKVTQALTSGTILGELKQKVTSVIERRFKDTPLEGQNVEFNTPKELLQFLYRLGQGVGKPGFGNQIQMFKNLSFAGKRIFDTTTGDFVELASKDISLANKKIALRNEEITNEEIDGKKVPKKFLTQEEKNALVENNMNRARQLSNTAVKVGINLEQSKKVSREDFLSGFNEALVKLTNTYDPSKGVPFGAYMNKLLPLKYSGILEKFKGQIETQTIENKEVEEVFDESNNAFENKDLSIGNRDKLSVDKIQSIEPISFLTKGNKKEGDVLESAILNEIEGVDLSKKTYSDLIPSNEIINAVGKIFAGGSKLKFQKGGGPKLTPEGKLDTFKANKEVISSQKEFIRNNAKKLYDMLPYASKMAVKGLKSSTKIQPVLVRNLYEKRGRANVETGTTAGLAKQVKPAWSPKVEKKFLELFGANKGAPPSRNQITAINALIRETAKSTLNSVARLKSITKNDIALYQQLADGKSDNLASFDIMLPKNVNKEKIISAAGLMALRKDNEAKEKYPEEFDIIENIRREASVIKEAELAEKYAIEDIAKEYDITTSEAKEKFLETETSYAQLRAVGAYNTRLKKLKGKTVGGSEWMTTQKLTLKKIIPKGLTFRDLPSDVQSMIYSTVQGGNTRFLINNGKGKPRPLTYKAWEKELKSKLNIKEVIAPPNKNANVTKGDLMDVVFGDIKGEGKKYKNDLNEAKYYSQVSGTKNYIEKLESQGKSPEETKKLVEQFMSKNEDIDATQTINKEILARVYQSYVDQVIKNPTKKTIENLIDTFQPLTNQAQSINKNNIVTTSFALKGETGPTKNLTKRFHNEHLLEFLQLNSNVIKDMRAFVDGKINSETLTKRVSNIVSSAEQAIISEKDRSRKDKTGPAKRDFIDGRVFLGEKATDQIVIGNTGSFSVAEQISKEVNAKEILRLGSNELSTTGVMVKQIVENSKEFKKVEVINKRIAEKAGIDAKDLNNTEILEKLKEKDKTNQKKLIESYASKDLNLAFNEIIEFKTGIGKEKTYSKAKAAVVGAKSGKVKLLASSAQDFEGLMYRTLGKGKLGDTQKKFYEEFLYRPLAQAEANLATDRVTMANNFKALKKQLKVSPKDLRKTIEGEPWSKEQAVRVHIWNKQGMTIPDISKSDLKLLNDFVKNDPKLEAYANELILLGKGTEYAAPSNSWEVGTITSDLIKGIQTTKRSQYLEPFLNNADIMFSDKNLNKLEAGFGTKYREALENSIARIRAGKNRLFFNSDSGSKLENRVLDYINNSTGAIMFFNTRSAVLQTLSAANFLNFKENNPLAAGKAFANQPQYWKDFSKLMNSDYLVDRRQGLRLNVAESEIADAVHDQTNKPKAALSYLLNKGFLPTKFADSFAIASGGATYYRNRIKMYKKQGMTDVEAEKKAYLDFMDTSEKSQQSSKAQRISMQQASNLGRVVLAFANTPSQYLRLTQKATSDLLNNRGSKVENISKIAYYSLVQNILFTTLQQATVGLLFDDDDDDKKQLEGKLPDVLSSSFDNLARGAGIGGAAVVTAKAIAMKIYKESEKKRPKYSETAYELLTFSPPLRSKILKIRSAGRSVEYAGGFKKLMNKGPGLDNPAYLAGANVVSAFTNVPLDRVVKKANNLKAAMDEQNAEWQRIALIMGWGKWELGIKDKKKARYRKIKRNKNIK